MIQIESCIIPPLVQDEDSQVVTHYEVQEEEAHLLQPDEESDSASQVGLSYAYRQTSY